MRKSVLVIVGLLIGVGIIAFIASHHKTSNPSENQFASGSNAVVESGSGSNKSATSNLVSGIQPPSPSRILPKIKRTNTVAAVNPSASDNSMTNWEERLDAILTSEEPEDQKAKRMIEMFPRLNPDAQEEVAHHISNLTSDENYASIAPFVTNTALPEAVLDVFTEDVLNRPNSIKLPELLSIARDPQHPKAEEAKDILELFLEENYGSDWGKWQAKMDQWLKENPD